MTLPKVLAVAVGSVLAAGTAGVLTVPAGPGAQPPQRAALAGASAQGTAPQVAAGRPSAATTGDTGRGAAGTARKGTGDGLTVPASQVPVGSVPGPVQALGSGLASGGRQIVLPQPSGGALPSVAPLQKSIAPDAVVMLNAPMTSAQMAALPGLKGIAGALPVDTGTVDLGGAPVVAFGVDPSTFRAYTPTASATSDKLWQYLAAGSLVSSYEMAKDRKLTLGQVDTITGSFRNQVKGWMGAFASIGLPGVDLLVSRTYSPDLHLVSDSGLVVSAPGMSGAALQKELESALPGAAVELLHPDQLPTEPAGNALAGTVRQKILSAALSRQGMPYVWGAAGPSSFDCSGLVQWAYRQAGILMPRVAAEQFLTGEHIPLADAEPGDLLFWTYDPNDPGYVDHVAIYLGNGLMVVAPHQGTNVQVASVPTADFAGAVQVVVKHS